MSNAAFYHRRGAQPKAATIVNRNVDGTVDLADAEGTIFVTSCALVDASRDPGDGVATLELADAGAATVPKAVAPKKKAAASRKKEG